jgi:uncharacterized damage-inducible protein DinB
MNVHDLLTLFDYNRWANERLLKAAEQLSAEEFTRTLGGAYDSVRTTFLHIIEVELDWFARCDGDMGWAELNPDNFPTLESIKEEWKRVEQFTQGSLSRLTEADLSRSVPYFVKNSKPRAQSVAEILQHAANHSSHHRGQIALMLRMMGHVPGNVDVLFYYHERHSDPVK